MHLLSKTVAWGYNQTGSCCSVVPHSSFRLVSVCHTPVLKSSSKTNQVMGPIVQSRPNKRDSGNKQLYLPSYSTGGHRQSPKGRRSPGKARKGVGSTFFINNKRNFPSNHKSKPQDGEPPPLTLSFSFRFGF